MENKKQALKRTIEKLREEANEIKADKELKAQDKIEQLEVVYEILIYVRNCKKKLSKENFERD